jgi:Putative metal-binding motif
MGNVAMVTPRSAVVRAGVLCALAFVLACSADKSKETGPAVSGPRDLAASGATSEVAEADTLEHVFATVEAVSESSLPHGVCAALRDDGSCVVPSRHDQDGDGYPAGRDCNDLDPNVHPGVAEIRCNLLDEDCDGADLCPLDRDRDGTDETTDCNDQDPGVNPTAPEIRCNGRDENCSGTDECDADGDGRETERPLPVSYTPVTHWVSGDCDDGNPTIYAGAPEVPCDGVDQDCDGADCCDDDKDRDGYACRVDDDDHDPAVHPGATATRPRRHRP